MESVPTYILTGVVTLFMGLLGYVWKKNDERISRLERSLEANSSLLSSVKEDVAVMKALLKE